MLTCTTLIASRYASQSQYQVMVEENRGPDKDAGAIMMYVFFAPVIVDCSMEQTIFCFLYFLLYVFIYILCTAAQH